eukprot:2450982-Amphidinium_carterae.2
MEVLFARQTRPSSDLHVFMQFVNFVVLAMNWLHFGRPRNGQRAEHVPCHGSDAQRKLADPLLERLSRKVATNGTPLLDGGL